MAAASAFAQTHPMPGSSAASPVLCVGCPGSNASGQPNLGLPTFPYSSPIKAHVGRYVDSVGAADNPGAGMRTGRAGRVVIAPVQRGSAPPRVYLQIGAALSAYSLDTFFSQRLPGGMIQVDSAFPTGFNYFRTPLEKVLRPDAFVYPESPSSGWATLNQDGQERLFEWDYDDRGYIYAPYSICGWGILKDDGMTSGGQLQLVNQALDSKPAQCETQENPTPCTFKVPFIDAKGMVSLKSGAEYYALLYNPETPGQVAIYNVTNPTAPLATPRVTTRKNQAIRVPAKTVAGDRIAFVDAESKLQIYNTTTYLQDGLPIITFQPSPARNFIGVSADEQGNFWAIEQANNLTTNVLKKMTPSGATYVETIYDVFGGAFTPTLVRANDGYLAVSGLEAGTQFSQSNDLRLFKISGGTPEAVDVKKFFRNYYHLAPSGYAQPGGYTSLVRDVMPVKYANKTYLIYAAHGLGDVFELQGGDSVAASTGATFGTANPNSKATVVGPYAGDPVTFTATAINPGFPLNVTWDFGNPEAGSANSTPTTTGTNVIYQYRALSTAGQITSPKVARVALTNDSTAADSVTINLKVPTPRVVVSGTDTVITGASPRPTLVAGDTFTDGSDGSVESHSAAYTIDGVTTTVSPLGTVPVGAVGTGRVLTFTAAYGPYTAGTFAPLATPTYNAQVASVVYDVRPFLVTIGTATTSGNSVTFNASARRSLDPTVILPSATTWAVTWTLKNASGVDIVPPQVTNPAIGTISPFTITDKSVITNGATAAVSVTIADAGLSTAALPFKTASASQTQSTPTAAISVVSGCLNTGTPCTLSTPAGTGYSYSWSLTGPVSLTGTNAPTFEPALSQPGTYTATVTVTSGIFTVTSAPYVFTVSGPACSGLPGPNSMFVTAFGVTSGCRGTGCQVGETIEFLAQVWVGYTVQPCDNFTWDFGDGTSGTGQRVQHTYAGSGPYTATVTISNSTGSRVFSGTVSFGAVQPTCGAPPGAVISVSGSQGCNGTSVPCKTGEVVTFTASRTTGALASCDNVSWTFSDFTSSAQSQVVKTFSSATTVVANLSISNSQGSAQASPYSVTVVTSSTGGGGCSPPGNFDFIYSGQQSGCSATGSAQCRRGETIQFTATNGFGYTYQSCDQYEWNFGDGSTSTLQNPTHIFNGGNQGYEVTFRVYNTAGSKTQARQIRLVGGDPAKPVPAVTFTGGPTTAGKNAVVTFSAAADRSATGWTWNFGDGQQDISQASLVSTTSTVQHTYANPGSYVVSVSARNAEDTAFATAGTKTQQIDITSTPEHRFLLPVVTRIGGFGGSIWRTDVQVYNSDPTVSQSNPLVLNVTFKGVTKQIEVASSTFISEDFMKYFTEGSDSGPMTISVMTNYQPQIWTRTYNQGANGTYGQFIPAILISGEGHSATALPTVETFQFLSGLRSSTAYRTNLGLVNPMDRTLNITVTAYDSTYSPVGSTQQQVKPFELVQFTVDNVITNVPKDKPYTIKITVPANAWLIAYASMIDQVSSDPTYIAAVYETDVTSLDYKDLVVPGVGHTGPWRSDVTIFNPDFEPTIVDLAYYNQDGVLSGEAKNVTIRGRNFLQLDDLLRAGVLTPLPADGVGSLRITNTWPDTRRFPIAYSRTYNFNGVSTFGQGIPAFSVARANVKPNKPAFIPAIRNDADKSYYTNIGLVNLTNQNVRVKVTLLRSDTGAEANNLTYDLKPYQSLVGNILEALGNPTRGSLKVSIDGSTGSVWAFASVIDRRTGDPEYLAGVPTP